MGRPKGTLALCDATQMCDSMVEGERRESTDHMHGFQKLPGGKGAITAHQLKTRLPIQGGLHNAYTGNSPKYL